MCSESYYLSPSTSQIETYLAPEQVVALSLLSINDLV